VLQMWFSEHPLISLYAPAPPARTKWAKQYCRNLFMFNQIDNLTYLKMLNYLIMIT